VLDFPRKKRVAEITSAILSHSLWKLRLYEAIWTGRSEWKVEDVRRNDLCEMGQFFCRECESGCEGEKAKACGNACELHAQFHLEAASVLELALAGKKEEAELAVSDESKFSTISSKLVDELRAYRACVASEECNGKETESTEG
jgi:hypothetical protein